MSGPQSQALAGAAAVHAMAAEAAARGLTVGRLVGLKYREKKAERERVAETQGGQIWRSFSQAERTLLVMHAAQDYAGDPRTVALQPWKSFTDRDQAAIGAMARQLARAFKDAVYLI